MKSISLNGEKQIKTFVLLTFAYLLAFMVLDAIQNPSDFYQGFVDALTIGK